MSTPARPRLRWRLLRGLFGLGVAVLLIVGVAIVGAAIWARTAGGRLWLRDQLVGLVAPVNGTLTVGTLETDLYSWAEVRDVTLVAPSGERVAHVDTLRVRYRLGGLVGGVLVVPEARVEGLSVTLTRTDAGLDIATMWDDGGPPSTEPWHGLPIDLVLDDVQVSDADVRYVAGEAVYGVDDAAVRAGVALRGPAVIVTDLALDAPTTTPALGPVAITAGVRWDPSTLWLQGVAAAVGPNRVTLEGGVGRLGADATVGIGIPTLHVEPDSLAPLTGPLPVTGVFDAAGTVAGLLAAPTLVLDVTTPGGPVHARASLDTREARPTWTAVLAPNDLALHTFLADVPAPTVLRGGITAQGTGLTWPDDLDATATLALDAPRLGELVDLSAVGDVKLSHGVLDLAGLRASAPGVRARADGTVRVLDETGELRVRDASLDLAALRAVGVTDARGQAGFSGNARFGWGERLGATVNGALRGTNVRWADVGTVGTLAGPLSATWGPDAGLHADADLAVTNLAAADLTAAAGHVDAVLRVTPAGALAVDGDLALDGVVGPGLTGDGATGRVDITRSAAGRLDGTVTLATTNLAYQGWRSDTGSARVKLAGDTATVALDLLDGDRTIVGFDGEIDLAARAVRARRIEVAPTAELAWRSDGVQTARLVDGGVADVRLRFTSAESLLSVEGYGAKKAPIDLRVEARDVRIDQLARLVPGRFDGYGGRVTLRASMEGPAARPALYVDLSADDLAIPDTVRRLDVDLQGVGGDGRLKVEGQLATGGERLARLDGDVPFSLAIDAPGLVSDGELDVHVLVPPTTGEAWNAILPDEPLPSFRSSLEVALTGKVLDPALSVVGIVDAPVGQRGEWLRLDVDARTSDGLFHLRTVGRERLERRIQVDGTLDLHLGDVARSLLGAGPARDLAEPSTWVGPVELDVVPLRLPVQALAGFVDGIPTKLRGDLSGGLHVSGEARAPRVEGALFLADGKLGELAISPALVTLVGAEGGYRVDADLGFGNRGSVKLGGFVPFAPTLDTDLTEELRRPGLALDVRAERLPLTAIAAAWPPMEATSGALSVNGTVTGSVLDPVPDLGFGLQDGDFTLAFTGIRYADAALTGRLTRDELRVDGLTVRTSRVGLSTTLETAAGTIRGDLVARRVDDRPSVSGAVVLDRAWIIDVQDRVLRVDGRIDLGDRGGDLHATGGITVIEGSLVVPERFFTGTSDLALPPEVRVLRRGAIAERTYVRDPTAPMFPTWLSAAISVNLDRNAFLSAAMPMEQALGQVFSSFSSIEVATHLDGEIVARVDDGELSLEGEVRPLRGTARVFSRPFEVTGDTISFTGRDWMNPVLDVVAVHTNPDYGAITTNITGTPSALKLDFSAEQSGLAKEDILSVLVLGRPSSELGAGEGQGLTGLLVALGSGFVNQQVAAGGSFTFDLFEVDMTGFRFGKRLSDDIFVLGEANWSGDATEENVIEVTLEWQVPSRYPAFRGWQFDLTTGTSGFSSLGWNRRWRF